MFSEPMSNRVKTRLSTAANRLRTANPVPVVGHMLEDSFRLPHGDPHYLYNPVEPFAAPLRSQFKAREPNSLSFELEPLGPTASGVDRSLFTTREMRGLLSRNLGSGALRWFDAAAESFRSPVTCRPQSFGALFGSSFDGDGLKSAAVSYEAGSNVTNMVNPQLARLIGAAMAALPGMRPVFTTLVAGRTHGSQWMTFLLTNNLRVADLEPVMQELNLGGRLAPIMQVVGVALGGRFDLPPGSTLVSFGRGPEGVEMELQVMLDAIDDVPPNFLQLLTMNLRERPSELTALERFLEAFTPENEVWPGRFSILGIRIGPAGPAKIGLFLRPIELEISPSAVRMPTPQPAAA